MLDFRIDSTSGLAPYAQLVQQVKQALRLGWLQPGDKLPTVHEVAASVGINPNTVQKAYKELEQEGLVVGRPGQGTFVQRSLVQSTPASLSALRRRLERWIAAAQAVGLDDEGIMDVVRATMRQFSDEASA
ncbi:MAG: GntR family transcriptional regulator [Actinomycetota bacterium]|nr:GntR family transcriptional regulator [Actinomycetota bacterium]